MAKSYKSVYSALGANLVIAITKFVAGAYTNSSSMISEGIHSLVDSINQVLLLYGLKRSKKPADKLRPLGYGKELYFWAFIVSILIFGLGGGLSIYQGVHSMLYPKELGSPTVNYIVLAVSFVFESISFGVAIKEFNQVRGSVHWWTAILSSKDPLSFLVLFEDAAAVLGIAIVAVFLFLGHTFDMPILDGVASVLVGLLLMIVALFLGKESRSLLMGEGLSGETQERVRALVQQDPAILKVIRILSTYQSPEEIVLILIVAFEENLNTNAITTAVERIRQTVKANFKHIEFVVVQPQASLEKNLDEPLSPINTTRNSGGE